MDADLPLVVDLDGTLIKSDTLLETLAAALRRAPWVLLLVPVWLLGGRARLKRELALRAPIEPAELPYRAELLDWIAAERARGRRVVLATAADEGIAQRIAEHLGAFDEVMASDGRRNLKGDAKAFALVERFGERGFDYVGDGVADGGVRSAARRAVVVESPPVRVSALARALRVRQWPKNFLVLVPLLTSHHVGDPASALRSVAALASFCLMASAIYVVNDLADLSADRAHEVKRRRVFASGELGIGWGLGLAPLAAAAAFALAVPLGPGFAATLALYLAVAVLYSLALKRVAVLDVMVVAALYAFRILAGALAIDVPVSDWLLAFSMFIFLSLAFAKRHGELARFAGDAAQAGRRLPRRGYRRADLPAIAMMGVTSGFLSVLVLALYITSRDVLVLYRHPAVLWSIAVLFLYWIGRAWLLVARGEVDEDPLSFALRDPPSYAVAALAVLAVYLAT
ncbi:MAG TPA: UbiA family prenyltransferase [Usitatibacter sp.]|nr:UbiA family prenyltransferase [Usitatibacter sp.]